VAKLIKCSGCGEKVSKNAKACPHCGEPVKKEKGTSLLTLLVLTVFIFAIVGKITSADKVTISTALNQEKIAQQKKAKEAKIQLKKARDTKYFSQSRDLIIKDINLKVQNKKYNDALKIINKYPNFKGKDENISKIHTKILVLLDKEKKDKQTKHAKEILKKLKTIPSKEYAKNKQLYQTLLDYEPNNKKYKAKVKFYSDKQKKKEEKEALKLAFFGKKPIQSAYDGSYYAVERYLEKVARDPDSVKITNCTGIYKSDYGWLVGCTWRGKNGFGGMNVDTNWFHIRQGVVVKMDKASAYSLH